MSAKTPIGDYRALKNYNEALLIDMNKLAKYNKSPLRESSIWGRDNIYISPVDKTKDTREIMDELFRRKKQITISDLQRIKELEEKVEYLMAMVGELLEEKKEQERLDALGPVEKKKRKMVLD